MRCFNNPSAIISVIGSSRSFIEDAKDAFIGRREPPISSGPNADFTRPWRKIAQRASPEPKGFQVRLFSFAEMATLSPAMSWHTGRKATPQPLTPDAFRPKAPNSPAGAFLLDRRRGIRTVPANREGIF